VYDFGVRGVRELLGKLFFVVLYCACEEFDFDCFVFLEYVGEFFDGLFRDSCFADAKGWLKLVVA